MEKILRERPAYARLVIGKAIRTRELAKKRLSIAMKNTEIKSVAPR
jgi:hypothetical protein